MKSIWKATIILAVLAVAAYAGYICSSGILRPLLSEDGPGQEKLAISGVFVNSTENTLSVHAQKMVSNSIHINGALIKDASGSVLYNDKTVNINLTNDKLTIIKVHYDALPSGVYTVTLSTTSGSFFVSPSFKVS